MIDGGSGTPTLRLAGRRAVMLGGAAALIAAANAPRGIALSLARGACLVRVLLDGRAALMVLDTGAERSILTQEATARLRLRRDPWIGTTLRGAGGLLERYANADIGHAEAGGVALFQRALGAGLSLPVTGSTLGGADGLLGGDVLRHFTLVLDVPGGRLLLLPSPMAGAVRLSAFRLNLLLAPVRLDGRALVALVDTRASGTLVNARGAYRLGLGEAQTKGDAPAAMAGIGGVSQAVLHRFSRLQVGALSLEAPRLLVTAVPEAAYDMTLGLDVLGRQPVVISYADLSLGIARAETK